MKKNSNSTLFEKASLIRDAVLAANDGIITTFAVVAGAQGANLGHNTVILLGLANLVADGISMSSGNFLGTESENEMLKNKSAFNFKLSPAKSSALTFGAFVIAGIIPLIPYVFFNEASLNFEYSIMMVGLSLCFLGLLRGLITRTRIIRTILETLIVGGLAAASAYGVGYWGDQLLNG